MSGTASGDPVPESRVDTGGTAPERPGTATGAPSPPVTRSVAAAMVMSVAGVIPGFLAGSLAVQIQGDLGFGPSALGVAVSAFFVGSSVSAVFMGRRVDRIGWQRGIRIAAAGSVVTLLGIAALARSWGVLVAFMLFGGIANSVSTPSANLAIARVVPVARRALMFGVKQSAVPISILLAGLSVPAIGLTVGWRWAFAGAVVCPLLAALAVPRTSGPVRPARAGASGATGPAGSGPVAPIRFAVAGGLGAAAQTSLTSFLVTSAVLIGVGEGMAGLLLSAGSAAGIVVRVTAGWVTDRRGTDGLFAVMVMLVLGGVGTALLAAGRPGPLLVLGTMLAFAAGWGWTGLFHYAVVVRNMGAPAAATGFAQAGLAGGATVGPLTFGLVADHVSFAAAWTVTAGISFAAAILVHLERRSGREAGG